MLSAVATFAWGPVSMRLYPHDDLPADAVVAELRVQAALASEHGFAGVMVSEHHGGFAGYVPNPLQLAGWLLDAMPRGWAAACPLLLPLRPTALVAEEVAWLAARFPERVAVGFAAGALPGDFELMNVSMDDLTARFATALAEVTSLLRGGADGGLARDPAISRCADHPVPVVSAAASKTAVRRAARIGLGVMFDSLSTPQRCRELTDEYRTAGGPGPCVLIRRAWIGEPPRESVERQLDVYRSYSTPAAQAQWQGEQLVAGDASAVAAGLRDAMEAAGCDCVNLRVHVPGVAPELAREQICRLGADVVPLLST
jgi:alkanesulfonate monooxygenase SsuD/methylene tetrahydromethanopterin reductase-like flavin-dependent oxidoreductase (luciferase family)